MNELLTAFEHTGIVEGIRQESTRGRGFILEFIKFAIVISIAEPFTSSISWFFIEHNIEPLASFGGIWMLGIGLLSLLALFYCLVWEDMRPRHMGLVGPAKNIAKGLLAGFAVGGIMLSVSAIVALACGGQVQFNSQGSAPVILSWIAIYLFQAFGEETMYRGAFMMAACRKNNAWIALVISSLAFSLHHRINTGYGPVAFVNLFLLAMILGITILATNRIWMATTIHGAWNFFQGNFFGIAVSGSAPATETTVLTSTLGDNPLISGGAMGLEGSLVTTAVLLVGLAAAVTIVMKRRTRPAPASAQENGKPEGSPQQG